jgi:hypothetical protein
MIAPNLDIYFLFICDIIMSLNIKNDQKKVENQQNKSNILKKKKK